MPVARKRARANESELGVADRRLAAALKQQVAVDEILGVMSNSPGDVQPVLYAVAERAAHLCEAPFRYLCGDRLSLVALCSTV